MSKLDQLCRELIETHDSKNFIHYIETTPMSEIGWSNMMRVIKTLESYIVKLRTV